MQGLVLISALAILVQTGGAVVEHPFAGRWTADLTKSKLHAGSPVRAATLQFAVTSESVSITDDARDASGQAIGTGQTRFQTDGAPHPHDKLLPGLTVVANWRGPRRLETVLTRASGEVDRVTYEVSADGHSLTTTTSGGLGTQVIVFRRH
jgi:hypothetical protein